LRWILENKLRLVLAVLNETSLSSVLPERQLVRWILWQQVTGEDGRRVELAQDRDEWQALALAVLNICALLLER
jgi:hypothetical protein